MSTTVPPPLTLRDPSSLQGQVPQVLYDWIQDLWHEVVRLGAQNVALQSQISSAHTVPLAKLTPTGTDGALTFSPQGVLTGFLDPT